MSRPPKPRRTQAPTAAPPPAAPPGPPPPPPPAKRRLRWGGVVLVAVAAYAYYFLGNLPQAQALDPSAVWPATPTSQSRFVLRDPAPGRLLSIDVRCPGAASLAFTPGVAIADPAAPLKGVRKLRMLNGDGQNLSLEVATAGPAGGPTPDIVLERPVGEAGAPVLRLSARGGPLQVKAAAIPDPRQGPQPRMFVVDGSPAGRPLPPTVKMVTAANAVIDITLPCRPSEDTSPLVISLGDLPAEGRGLDNPDADPTLAVRSVSVISAHDGLDAKARWMACGAPEGGLNWRRPTPGIGPGDCEAGRLSVGGLQFAGKGLSLGLQGSAYLREDNKVYAWPLMHELYENEILKLVLVGAALALVTWAGLRGKD